MNLLNNNNRGVKMKLFSERKPNKLDILLFYFTRAVWYNTFFVEIEIVNATNRLEILYY